VVLFTLPIQTPQEIPYSGAGAQVGCGMTDMPEHFFLHQKLDEIECYSDASSARKSTSVVFSRVMDALIVVYRDSPTHGPVHSKRPFEQPSILQGHAGSEAK
jgi:hypothetical protein